MSKRKAFRFSPSNTGKLHLGSARTAMISYVLAQQVNADFHLRIEDTDLARSTEAFERDIVESISWLGIQFNETVVRQTQQAEGGLYSQVADILTKNHLAYYCGCSRLSLQKLKAAQIQDKLPIGYTGICRGKEHSTGPLRLNMAAVRLFLDEDNEYGGLRHIKFTDNVFGSRNTDLRDLNDVILMRASGDATYLMANTVDDLFSGVTDIVRGADILPQAPIQIILRTIVAKLMHMPIDSPQYTHVPLVLGEGGEKLSKRSPSTKSILELKAEGIFPDAITQFTLAIGNNSISKEKALNLQEIVECYDPKQNAKNNVAFSTHQLLFINKLHLRRASTEELNTLMGTSFLDEVLTICKGRVNNLVSLKEDAEQVTGILDKFDGELYELKESGITPESCRAFRDEYLNGSSGVSLKILASL